MNNKNRYNMMQKGGYGAMEDEDGQKEGSAGPRGQKRPSVVAQLDRWLKSDLSSRNVFGSMAAPERLGMLNKYMKVRNLKFIAF